MIKKYIIIPNVYYDNIQEPYRLLTMLGVYLILIIALGFRIGMLIFALIGLWRITYFIVTPAYNIKVKK